MIQVYNTHFYGSVIWYLGSQEVDRLEKSWNVAMRKTVNLPRNTHCYLIESVSEEPHVRIVLTRRFLFFIISVSVYSVHNYQRQNKSLISVCTSYAIFNKK